MYLVLTVEVQPDILIGLYIFTLIGKTNAKVDYLYNGCNGFDLLSFTAHISLLPQM